MIHFLYRANRCPPGRVVRPVFLFIIALALLSLRAQTGSADRDNTIPLKIIVVSSPEQAEALIGRLEKGEDFSRLAQQYSTDPTAADGGYLGVVAPSSLRAELRQALQGLALGQISRVTRIPSGYAILQVQKAVAPAKAAPDNRNPARLLPLASAGAVRLSPDIGGFTQANVAMQVFMPKDGSFGRNLQQVCEVRHQAIDTTIGNIERFLANSDADPEKKIFALFTLGQLHAYRGDLSETIAQWTAAYQLALAQSSNMLPQLEESLGLAHLYRASAASEMNGPVDESRLFPLHPGALHPNPEDTKQAIAYLTKSVARDRNNLELVWLLNLAYIEAGGYPAQVPKPYLIPPAALESEETLNRFHDVAPSAGLNIRTTAGGVIVDDFDNDGLFDVVTSQQDDCALLHFFHNNGNGSFSDQSAAAGLADQLGGLNILQADYNNDGCVDILVLRGGWEFPHRVSLLRNNCRGAFTDVTEQSGLAQTLRSTQSAVWTDIDNDGRLDLFIANENAPAELFWNKGDGSFVDISHAAGIDRIGFSKAVVAGDYDNDGYPDIYVSNLNGNNFLYHNNGDRTFTDVAAKAGVEKPWASFAAWFFDYDNDGWPDLFVTSYYMSVEETARGYLHLPPNGETLKLYRNQGNGTFLDVSAETHLNRVFMPMGSNFGDIDNDGFLDIYLGNGNPSFGSLVPSVLLHNRKGKSFADVSASTGTGAMSKGHGVAFADLDNDGDEDIFAVMGGAVPGDRHTARLFENPGNRNNWLSLHLVGDKSNRSAIGARIKVTVTNNGGASRSIYRTVGSGGSFGASPLTQHIGLGPAARIETVEIWWPASQCRQTFSNVTPDQCLEIKEFARAYTTLNRPRFQFLKAK